MHRLCVLICLCLGLLVAVPYGLSAKDMQPASGHHVLTYDVPGAVYGTYPYMIISNGDVAGAYYPDVQSCPEPWRKVAPRGE